MISSLKKWGLEIREYDLSLWKFTQQQGIILKKDVREAVRKSSEDVFFFSTSNLVSRCLEKLFQATFNLYKLGDVEDKYFSFFCLFF